MYLSARFFVLIGLIVCSFVQTKARKRGNDELNGITPSKSKQPLPFDLNEPAPVDDSDVEQPNKKRLKNSPEEKKSKEFYKARYVRDRKRMNEDSNFLQQHLQRQAKYRDQKKVKLTEEELQARKEATKIINHQQYLRRKAKYGSQTIKQRREIAEIKTRMSLGPVSDLERERVEDYYKRKRTWDKAYQTKRKQKRKQMMKSDGTE